MNLLKPDVSESVRKRLYSKYKKPDNLIISAKPPKQGILGKRSISVYDCPVHTNSYEICGKYVYTHIHEYKHLV